MSKDMWNERFAEEAYAYGEEPNAFIREIAPTLPPGRVLCLAEGEGRNAVHIASLGREVTMVDWSEAGLAKARRLAERKGVHLVTILADLADYAIEPGHWNGIVLVFAHLPPPLRRRIHRACVDGLAPGGILLLEAYNPEQVRFGTGGPKDPDLLMTKPGLIEEFAGLEILHAAELVRDVTEGPHHTGDAAVVQFIGRKPA